MTVYIYPNFNKDNAGECTLEVCKILSSLNVGLILPYEACGILTSSAGIHARCLLPEEGITCCDILISIGGDGTILKCAELAARNLKPLLGINCGRLGFMATLERDELFKLSSLVDGCYTVEERMMLSASINRSNGKKESLTALNEAVISSGAGRDIHDFTVMADRITVSSLRADGLIFSTPTGASAYSLSAGGPLIEPALDCIEFTQICPHSLFARTMIFSPDKIIEIKFDSPSTTRAALSVDGSEPRELTKDDSVTIERSPLRLKLIDINGGSYFKAVNSKLMRPAKGTV